MNERIKAKIISIVRIVLLSLAGLAMLYFAVSAATALYEKESVLDEMRAGKVLSEARGMTIDATDLSTYTARHNIEFARELWKTQDPKSPLNEVSLFEAAYNDFMAKKAAAGELTKAQIKSAKTDGSDMFRLMMLGFAYGDTKVRVERPDPESPNLMMPTDRTIDELMVEMNDYQEKFFKQGALFVLSFIVLLAIFCAMDKNRFNCFVPKGEKTTFGLPAYLSIVLCYLTLGLYGLVLFFYERKSRFVRMAAVQSMLAGMVAVAIYLCTTLMFTIFSYMFPPIAIIIYVIQMALIASTISFQAFALVMALANRSVRLPIFGKLAINSSHCDVVG